MTRLHVYIPTTLHAELHALKRATGASLAEIVRRALARALQPE
jgi:Ribbon-helix-helix protein, copG family